MEHTIATLVALGVIGLIVYLVVRKGRAPGSGRSGGDRPEDRD